jgi:general secretion pathway protein D
MIRRQQTSETRARRVTGRLAVIGAVALLPGCTTLNRLLLPTDQQPIVTDSVMPPPVAERAARPADAPPPGPTVITAVPGASTVITATPALPPEPVKRPPAPAKPPPFPVDERRDISLNFEQAPLPTFIQVVFGGVLKVNVLVDPAVAQRQDLVTLRTGKPQNRNEVLETARLLLKTYGVAVIDVGGAYRIVPDAAAPSYSPDIQRGRALPDVPQPMRPVFHLYELQAVRVQEAGQWLKTIFGTRVTFTEDTARNAILISGMPESVAAVIEAIEVLDQPLLRGRSSVRIEPAYWTADELARRLVEILTAQGYSVGTVATGTQPTILLPVAAINSIIAFSVSRDVLEFVTRWVRELDQPGRARAGGATGIFTYSARNTDARDLARTLQEILAGPTAAPAAPAAPGQPPRPQTPPRVVVHPGTNTLIFQGAPDSYTQLVGLLQELDRPARTALIEVTVAEIRLSDRENLGIEWAISERSVGNHLVSGGTLGGLGIGSDGLLVRVVSSGGATRALINALAATNRARVLSSPRLMARNGEQATIQVGQEVPIITSQQTTGTTDIPGSILQTIQYRQTGVILRVRPIIHSGGRIELDVTQEVSAASETTTGVNNSPTISNRKVETKLSLADGNTVLLAGLISQNDARTDTGVPILKDVPLIGQFFRVNTDTTDRTELIVLITPYVVNNDFEARAITEAFRSQLGPWAQPVGKPAVTLPALTEPPPVPVPAPTPPAAPLPLAPPAAAPATAPAATMPNAAPPAGTAPSAPPAAATRGPGTKVEDPKLLEELQRSIATPPKPSTPPKSN